MNILRKPARRNAFTLVELVIVISVIGILAGVTIVGYNGFREKARAAAAADGASQAADLLEAYQLKNGGLYPTSLAVAGVTDNDSVKYQYTQVSGGTNYCVTATSKNVSYKISQDAKPIAGACDGHGLNGVDPITNIATNPSFETNLTGYNGITSAITRTNTWAGYGTYSMEIAPSSSSSNDSFANIGGDLGGFRAGLQAGKTYTISGTVRLTAPLAGTLNGNGSRQITAWYTSSGGAHTRVAGSQAPNAAGTTRVSVTYTIPSTAIGAWIRIYNGAYLGNGSVWWDGIMITEGTTQYAYADGTSTNWVWNGTPAHGVTSTGPPL